MAPTWSCGFCEVWTEWLLCSNSICHQTNATLPRAVEAAPQTVCSLSNNVSPQHDFWFICQCGSFRSSPPWGLHQLVEYLFGSGHNHSILGFLTPKNGFFITLVHVCSKSRTMWSLTWWIITRSDEPIKSCHLTLHYCLFYCCLFQLTYY